jgi:hypothetical protein
LLFGTILEQMGIEPGGGVVARDGEHEMSSRDSPELNRRALFLRGSDTSKDSVVFSCTFNSPEEAARMADAIGRMVASVNSDSIQHIENVRVNVLR